MRVLRVAVTIIATTSCLLLAEQATGQACYAENDGPSFEDASSTGDAAFGIKCAPDISITAGRAEVFTGEVTDQHGVAIWSHDAVNDLPLAPLGQASFPVNAVNDWQGADLVPPVALTANTTYWFVWTTTSGSQTSIDVPMAFPGQEFRVSLDGGATWTPIIQSTDRHFKFRIGDCGGNPCSGAAVEYGMGCAGSNGLIPRMSLPQCAIAGSNVTINIDDGTPSASALVFLGLGQANLPIGAGGCALLVAPLLPVVLAVPLSGTGSASLVGPLPATASGASFTVQSLIPDPAGTPPGLGATNGITLTVQ